MPKRQTFTDSQQEALLYRAKYWGFRNCNKLGGKCLEEVISKCYKEAKYNDENELFLLTTNKGNFLEISHDYLYVNGKELCLGYDEDNGWGKHSRDSITTLAVFFLELAVFANRNPNGA